MGVFETFQQQVRALAPRTAIVLGSGLAEAAAAFQETASVPFAEIPGLASPTVHGHRGRLSVGTWNDVPTLIFQGRLHFYEGHPIDKVIRPVEIAAELGATTYVLTNAAGGIDARLRPGCLMAIRSHLKFLGGSAWRDLAIDLEKAAISPYSLALIDSMVARERAAGRELICGTYAALPGPCYETPAEIRGLARCGVAAVGMSTAPEAEAAAKLGLEVAAISCITNAAAGLGSGTLCHEEVLDNARLAVARLGELLVGLVQVSAG
jgi:purine-nucleoside phosphorylase